ncbi:MAG: sigma-70 family RNA polymerase sigma factor [Gemmatimonadetes bacterium]|nr:sigma-70 family RNA polymerase sigma factor [Gemmatimonadota bacterium]
MHHDTGTGEATAPRTVDPDVSTAAAGDDRAFERLYRLHVGRIHALALRLAADSDDAERLTQDVFVRAWERLGSFRGDSAFGTWLHRLAVNLILSDRRSAWRRTRRVVPKADLEEEMAASLPVNVGDRLDLDAAIAMLPPGARTVFVLHDVEGYEHAEIAGLTGVAVGTSKAQLFRARRLLREVLDR